MLRTPHKHQYAQRSTPRTNDASDASHTDTKHALTNAVTPADDSEVRLQARTNGLGRAVGAIMFMADDLWLAWAGATKASVRTLALRLARQ